MIDHRDIPGIEWVSSPGPLRAGDYWRKPVSRMIERCSGDVGTTSDHRVIPVVPKLETPEPTDDHGNAAEVAVNEAGNLGPVAEWHRRLNMSGRWALANPGGASFELNNRAQNVGDGATSGDAVLWVVEGKRP